MGKAQRRKIIARMRIRQQINHDAPRLRNDPVMQELFMPLLAAAGQEHATLFWSIIEQEASGVLAWGVQTGYLLWVRTHPGEIPTRAQVREWTAK